MNNVTEDVMEECDVSATLQYSFDVLEVEETTPGWLTDELERCRKFYNVLTAIRKKSNKNIEDWRINNNVDYQLLSEQRKNLQDELTTIYDGVRKDKKQQRAHVEVSEEVKVGITELKSKIKDIDCRLSKIKRELKNNEIYVEYLKSVNDTEKAEKKSARQNCGCHWGNYNGVLASIQGEPFPQFKRWEGEAYGRLCMQIQGFKGKEDANKPPVTWGHILSGKDSRVKASVIEVHKKKGDRIRLRINWGRNQTVTLEFWQHRDISKEALISNIWLLKRKHSYGAKWSVNFVLYNPQGWLKEDVAKIGEVGVDWNYRKVKEGIRVAYWVGSDGGKGQLVIPNYLVERDKKIRDLQSIRDINFDTVHKELIREFGCLKAPEWFIKETEHFGKWDSQLRLMILSNHWREQRFISDEMVFGILEEWRKQELHLCNWQENQRKRIQRQRKHIFRNWTALMRRKYQTFYIEDCKISELRKDKEPQEKENPELKFYRNIASPGELMSWIAATVGETVKVKPNNSTKTCNDCGKITDWSGQLIYQCEFCQSSWDCDENAARNLLKWGRAVRLCSKT